MKQLFIALVAAASVLEVAAQNTLMLATGESLGGTITAMNSTGVRFRLQSGSVKRYTPDEIKIAKGNSGTYYSKKVDVITAGGAARINQLLRLETDGPIKTFSYTAILNRQLSVNYYIEKGDSELIFIGTVSGAFAVRNPLMTNDVLAKISALFSDEPELRMRFDQDKNKIKKRVIHRYVEEYNRKQEVKA